MDCLVECCVRVMSAMGARPSASDGMEEENGGCFVMKVMRMEVDKKGKMVRA